MQRTRGAMAERRARPRGENRGHPAALAGQTGLTDRVHTAMHEMQPAAIDELRDRVPSEPDRGQLPARDD